MLAQFMGCRATVGSARSRLNMEQQPEAENGSQSRGAQKQAAAPSGNERGSLVTVRLPNGFYITKKVVSLRQARYKKVIPQKYDLSCGAAALATLLNYFFNHEVKEIDIIKYMLESGDKKEIGQKGFSLLDLKKYAVNQGYMADGYKVSVSALQKLKIPAIVLFTSGPYSHFVVLKGVKAERIYVADPAYGNRSMSLEMFQENWNGVIFLVANRNTQNQTPLPLDTTLPAPVLSLIRVRDFSTGGFSRFQVPGEF